MERTPTTLVASRLLAALVLCLAPSAPAPPAMAATAPALVKTMIVEAPDAGVTRTFFGEVVARETVTLGFQVGGRLVAFHAPEGEVIEQGAVIARLDPVPFEIAVERARLELEQAHRKLDRFERLVGNTISDAQLQDAWTEAGLAEVALRDAEYELSQTILAAPFDAMVATRHVANFSTVAAGTQVVRLHDLSEFRVDIEVPEVLIQQLGNDPNVTLQGRFPGSGDVHPLAFREMNAETAEIGQTFRVTLAFEAMVDRLLLPGASMVVSATLHDIAEGLIVPASAIATDPEGRTSALAVVETAEGLRLERVSVRVDVAADGGLRVVDGLEPGAEIVAGGLAALGDGQAVRRFEAKY